jgi:hypothetical protein
MIDFFDILKAATTISLHKWYIIGKYSAYFELYIKLLSQQPSRYLERLPLITWPGCYNSGN